MCENTAARPSAEFGPLRVSRAMVLAASMQPVHSRNEMAIWSSATVPGITGALRASTMLEVLAHPLPS